MAHAPYPLQGPLDIVFCRNVMIYFDQPMRTRLLGEICRLLRPGGLLCVGMSESLAGMTLPLKNIEPAVFQRR